MTFILLHEKKSKVKCLLIKTTSSINNHKGNYLLFWIDIL